MRDRVFLILGYERYDRGLFLFKGKWVVLELGSSPVVVRESFDPTFQG